MAQSGKGRPYPVQKTAPVPAPGGQAYPGSYPQGPPPPYSQQAYPQQMPQQYPMQPGTQYHAHQYAPQFYQRPPPPYQPQQTVVLPGGFDAGARLDPATASIPPPPPGCIPNAAQLAAANGQKVVVTQRPRDFFTGGSDGGYVIW